MYFIFDVTKLFKFEYFYTNAYLTKINSKFSQIKYMYDNYALDLLPPTCVLS